MAKQSKYKLAVCNSNGLHKHAQELKTLMIPEIYFIDIHYLRVLTYKLYHTKHQDDRAHGGTPMPLNMLKERNLPRIIYKLPV